MYKTSAERFSSNFTLTHNSTTVNLENEISFGNDHNNS